MIKYRKLKNLLIWKCKQKKVGSQLPTATRMAELEEVEPPVPLVLLPCTSCNRTFRPEALSKHAKVCEKTLMKKRKKFDSSRQRLQGTDVPVFPPPPKPVKESPLKPMPQSKWREKQAELAKTLHSVRKKGDGGPSIPIKPSDHEQCPYCERYFGPKAYDRHAEWCKEQHIKLKNSNNINHEARERLQVRTKYRAPLSNKVLTRDKYLPRSRDPSPMSMSRIEAEEPSRTKFPSPALTRSSSLRLSNRSKSMVNKAPSIPPVELRDSRVRHHQSSISVRGREQLQSKEPDRASLMNGTDEAKPKIVNVNQHSKKVTENENERNHKLRKCRSWTSPVILQPLTSQLAEDLQVYSCILHPLTGKRSHESCATHSEGRKRSVSVSKSFDILSHTYTIERNVVRDCPLIVDEEDGLEVVREQHQLEVDEEDDLEVVREQQQFEVDEDDEDTGEMISDDILRSDSWKQLPVVLLEIHHSEKLTCTKNKIKHQATKKKHPSLEFQEPKMICAPDMQPYICRDEKLEEEAWEDELGKLSSAADEFLMWFRNNEAKCIPQSHHTNECGTSDTGASQFSFDENHDSIFADFQMFMENSATSECNYSRCTGSNHFVPPPNFVKIDAIVEINDVGTTVDDLEAFINQQIQESEHIMEDGVGNPNQKVETETNRQFESVSVQTALQSPYEKYHQLVFIENSDKQSIESDSFKAYDEHNYQCPQNSRVQETCGEVGAYVLNSKGSLNTNKDIRADGDAFYLLSDSNDDSLASYPFSFLNIPNDCDESTNPDYGVTKPEKSIEFIEESTSISAPSNAAPNTSEVTEQKAAGDFAIDHDRENNVPCRFINPSLNEIIALIIDVKNKSRYIDENCKSGDIYKALNDLNSINDTYNKISGCKKDDREAALPIMKCESTQVDFPCLKCLAKAIGQTDILNDETAVGEIKSSALGGTQGGNGNMNGFVQGENEERNVKYCSEIQPTRGSRSDSCTSLGEVSTGSFKSTDQSSNWDVSDSSSDCSCEDFSQDETFTKKKTVKYYETIEYRETKKGASTIKTSVKELPPLRNPPKRLLARTIKKEVKPITFGGGVEGEYPRSRRISKLNSECLKLPPIKRRFERHPCLTRASSGEGDAPPRAEPSKFCHECGSKYPVALAKFCCNCGIRRIAI